MTADRVFTWPPKKDGEYQASDGPNPAYEPQACGLEIIDELDQPDLLYEFNTIMAWRDLATSKVYIADSSGCSCPTPFEEYKKLSDLTLITSITEAQDYVRVRQPQYDREEGPYFPLRDVLRFIAKIDLALRKDT